MKSATASARPYTMCPRPRFRTADTAAPSEEPARVSAGHPPAGAMPMTMPKLPLSLSMSFCPSFVSSGMREQMYANFRECKFAVAFCRKCRLLNFFNVRNSLRHRMMGYKIFCRKSMKIFLKMFVFRIFLLTLHSQN